MDNTNNTVSQTDKTETEIVDYKRIFYGEATPVNTDITDVANTDKQSKEKREKKFIAVFFMQSVVCLAIIFSAVILKYADPVSFESVSSVLNGFYEDNITLSDLNKLIDEKIMNNGAIATFFNFSYDK